MLDITLVTVCISFNCSNKSVSSSELPFPISPRQQCRKGHSKQSLILPQSLQISSNCGWMTQDHSRAQTYASDLHLVLGRGLSSMSPVAWVCRMVELTPWFTTAQARLSHIRADQVAKVTFWAGQVVCPDIPQSREIKWQYWKSTHLPKGSQLYFLDLIYPSISLGRQGYCSASSMACQFARQQRQKHCHLQLPIAHLWEWGQHQPCGCPAHS